MAIQVSGLNLKMAAEGAKCDFGRERGSTFLSFVLFLTLPFDIGSL